MPFRSFCVSSDVIRFVRRSRYFSKMYVCFLSFSDMIGLSIKVFMDDFSFFGNNLIIFLYTLMLFMRDAPKPIWCWIGKIPFIVIEGIILGHKILAKGIEVDPTKIEVIEKSPLLVNVKGVRSFLEHVSFYRRFIKDFSKISKSIWNLLVKENDFVFDERCLKSFYVIKEKIIVVPYFKMIIYVI